MRSFIALTVFITACGSTPRPPEPGTGPDVPEGPIAPRAPAAPQLPVVDRYHGIEVTDPYRWLEAPDAPEVKSFVDAQNAWARAYLDTLGDRVAVKARLTEILSAQTVAYGSPVEMPHGANARLYALKLEPPKAQRMLVAMPDPDATGDERVVLDPNALDASGKTAIDWYRVSPDGRLVAVSLSSGGSETGDVHVYETATGKPVFEVIPGVNAGTAGGDLAWLADSKGFYYSRYPRGDERPEADKLFYVQLYRHMLGTPTADDTYELGKDFPRIAEVFATVADNGDTLCTIQKGDGGEFELWLQRGGYKKAAPWQRLATFEDAIVQAFFGPKDDLYLVSRKGAPKGQLLRAPRKGFALAAAKVIIAESDAALVSDIWDPHVITIHGGRIYVGYQLGGPSEVRVFDLGGKPVAGPELLPVASVGAFVPLGKSDILFAQGSFLEPNGWYRFSPGRKTTSRTAISTRSPVDLKALGVTVVREMATSKDGTKVPVNILLPKGADKGKPVPFVVTGYGGYGVNVEPAFQAMRSPLFERGIGVAIVNLRGGGEFGEDWHKGGMLTNKQNVFDDFVAALEHLVTAGYAIPGRIGITGGSNGGLLMGAVLTQRPELVAAVTSYVGIYDMLRVETEPNGAFNTTEFGSVTDPDQFRALFAYSPYHHVADGTRYPPTLFLVGANDVRVAPWHSRKLVARLQAAAAHDDATPHLLVTNDAGHGIGSSIQQTIEQQADGLGFLVHHLTR